MDLGTARSMRDELLRGIQDPQAIAGGTVKLQTAFRDLGRLLDGFPLAIGYSHQDDDYRLEVRVQSRSRTALRAAKTLCARYDPNANVASVLSVTIPRPRDSDVAPRFAPFCNGEDGLQLGDSISNLDGGAGSIGGFLEDKDGAIWILSCNHVLALFKENLDDLQTSIVHPARIDLGRPPINDDVVAYLGNYFTLLSRAVPNECDAAIAALRSHRSESILGNRVPVGFGFQHEGKPIRTFGRGDSDWVPERGTKVYKLGRSTGQTIGRILGSGEDCWRIRVSDGKKVLTYLFKNVLEVAWGEVPFSEAGDSGSLCYAEHDGALYGLGLVFAASEKLLAGKQVAVTLCCSLKDILRTFHSVDWLEDPDA